MANAGVIGSGEQQVVEQVEHKVDKEKMRQFEKRLEAEKTAIKAKAEEEK